MEEIIEVRVVRIKDVLIYKKGVTQEELDQFKHYNDLVYLEETSPTKDSIRILRKELDTIMLVEWKKYKVSSFSDKVKFKEEDFIKIGECL